MATSKSRAIVKWDEKLAQMAAGYAKQEENTGGGQFFSVKSGQLTWQDSPLPGNKVAVIILDGLIENAYYAGEYDADNPQPPKCFAFGRVETEMAPHEQVIELGDQENDMCQGCPNNAFGSAERGNGKACKNSRRLAMIPAGTFKNGSKFEPYKKGEELEGSSMGFLKLPPTSIKGFAAYVKQLEGTLRRPPFAVYTLVSVVPDPKTQFKIVFETLGLVPDNLLDVAFKRHEEAKSQIEQPYMPPEEAAAPKRGAAKKPAAKKASGRSKY